MAIEFACRCGKRYQVGVEFVGRQVTCQACRATLTVPAPGRTATRPAQPAPTDDDIMDLPGASAPSRKAAPSGKGNVRPGGGSRSGEVPRQGGANREADLDFGDQPRRPARKKSSGIGLAILGCFGFFFLGSLTAGGGLAFFFWDFIKVSNPQMFASAGGSSSSSSESKSDSPEPTDTKKSETKTSDTGTSVPKETTTTTTTTTKPIDTQRTDPKPEPIPAQAGPWKGATSSVLTMAIANDGKTVWTAGGGVGLKDGKPAPAEDSTLRQWDAEGKQIGWLKDFKNGIGCAAFGLSLGGDIAVIVPAGGPLDPNDRSGALGTWSKGADTNVHLWDLRSRKEKRLLPGNAKEINCVAIAPGGLHVASAGKDLLVHISDADSGAQEAALAGHTAPVNVVLFSPDAARIASAGLDKGIRIWDRTAGTQERYLQTPGNTEVVWSLAYAPTGLQLASGGGDAAGTKDFTVRVWDLAKGAELVALPGHTDRINAVTFSVDGTRVVSGSKDGTVRLWQVSTGKMVGQVNVMCEVTSLAVAPDGRRVLVGASDGSLRFWNFPADVATVIKKLETAQGPERLNVLRDLAGYGSEARPARQLLLKLVTDPNADVRNAAFGLVVQLGVPDKTDVPVFIQFLALSDFPDARSFALDGLIAVGADASPAIAPLTAALKDADPVVRAKAATALGAIGAEAKAMAFVPMLGLMGDKDAKVVEAAANALTKLGKPEKDHTRAVAELLSHPNEPVRRFALNALTDLGPAAADAGPALVAQLGKETVPALRKQCLLAMAQAMPGSKELLTAYTTSLMDADAEVSKTAAVGLGKIGTNGGALQPLLAGLDNPNLEVAQACLESLDRGPITKQQVILLRQALPGTKDTTRRLIIALLRKLGPDANDAVPGIIEVLKVGNLDARKEAVELIGIIGPPAKSAGADVAARLADADPAFKLQIAQTLAKIGAPEVNQAIPALVKGLKVEDPEAEAQIAARKQLSDALVVIGEPAVDPLMTALEKDFFGKEKVDVAASMAALQTLQGMGKKAKGALNRLFKLQKEHPSPEVKKAIKVTIDKIQ